MVFLSLCYFSRKILGLTGSQSHQKSPKHQVNILVKASQYHNMCAYQGVAHQAYASLFFLSWAFFGEKLQNK